MTVSARFTRAAVSVFYIGHFPAAPGTFSSLAACVVVMFFDNGLATLGFALTSLAAGLVLCAPAQKAYESDDPSQFVLDEWCGMCVALLFLPLSGASVIAAFVLFRFFDILKPLGIRALDAWDHPYSIMADDVLAGLYANLVLQFTVAMRPSFFLL